MARIIGDTFIKCKRVGATVCRDAAFNTYTYEPVCGTGTIVLNALDELSDNVVPMEHLRMKAQVDILTELNYPVDDICRIVGAPEYLVRQYLYKDYAGLNHDDIHNELHRLYTRCTELLEQNTKLNKALESEMADNLLFEHRGKELTEKNDILNENLATLQDEYHKLEEKAGEYIRVCKARDEDIKHINALENKIKELEHDKKVTADMYDLANKTLCEVRAENAKLQERIDAYAIIMRSHIDSSSLKREALELGKWVFTAVGALHNEGKSIEEIADLLEMPATFVTHVLKDF